ncbi:MAG: 3-hydroxybutyryl-CoA dehydrogenase [Nitrososphaerota archaeon]|nr:3-hydroxybutyryl-CoA dehydrogenase [Nitrososphaerota archaeon]
MDAGVSRVAVLGAGTMGHGIAEVLAMSGREVRVRDVEQRFVDGAREKIGWSLARLREKGQLREEPARVMGRLSFGLDLKAAVKGCDMVIEAVPEDVALKRRIFGQLEKLAGASTILATNTSSLPIDEVSSAVGDPSRVVGVHFFNPPVIMRLVEVIRGPATSQSVVDRALALVTSLDKRPVLVRKGVPGFVVNRILVRMMSTARLVVQRGMASVQEVDAALKYDAGLPMGAFELADYIGLDVMTSVERAMAERGFPVPAGDLFESMVKAGTLGTKTGSGFYVYSKERPRAAVPRELAGRVSASLLLSPSVNEAAWLIANSIASREDVDAGVTLGLGFPAGIFAMASRWGAAAVVSDLESLKQKTGEAWLEPEGGLRTLLR